MNAEFRAYINAITEGCCEEMQRASLGDSISHQAREVFAALGDVFADILRHTSPYHCDLHPWTRVRQTIRGCARHEAIGYHGLA